MRRHFIPPYDLGSICCALEMLAKLRTSIARNESLRAAGRSIGTNLQKSGRRNGTAGSGPREVCLALGTYAIGFEGHHGGAKLVRCGGDRCRSFRRVDGVASREAWAARCAAGCLWRGKRSREFRRRVADYPDGLRRGSDLYALVDALAGAMASFVRCR